MSEKEYIVTVKKGIDWKEVHNDIINDTTHTHEVDSNIVPDRACSCIKLRQTNNRNTHYSLTDEEAQKLKNDSRIENVQNLDNCKKFLNAVQDDNFDRNSDGTGKKTNWGLLRHINETNVYASSTDDPGGTYDYVLDGTGVDVVIVDSGIDPNHPEFQDAEGNSRVQQVDWYAISGVTGTLNANHYRDHDGHGTHVASTVAGKNFGWAKNAHIYSMKVQGLEGSNDTGTGMPEDELMDCLIAWHNKKTNPSDPAYTGRPTVVNHSWGYGYFAVFPDSVNYRGAVYTQQFSNYGLKGPYRTFRTPTRVTSLDVDIEACIDAGMMVCIAAGNNTHKIDIPTGPDYNNTFTNNSYAITDYYHRGSSPHVGTNPGFMVGSIDAVDYSADLNFKAEYSESGPAVEIYAVGSQVMGACSNASESISRFSSYVQDYYYDSNYKQMKISGTSMASPQVAGICALILQAHPDWSPSQVKNYIINNSKDKIFSSGLDDDFITNYGGSIDRSLLGSEQRVAYLPMKGKRPFTIG